MCASALSFMVVACVLLAFVGGCRSTLGPRIVGAKGDELSLSGEIPAAGLAEIWHDGEMVGFARIGEDGTVKRVLGRAPKGAVLRPVGMPPCRAVVLAPSSDHPAIGELQALFHDSLHVTLTPAEFAQALREKPNAAIALADPGASALASAPAGVRIVCSLQAYAAARGLTPIRHRVPARPSMKIVQPAPWLAGISVGQELPWYGTEKESFLQQSLSQDCLPAGAQVHAVSTIDRQPIMLAEPLPGGGCLMALDLESPNGKPGYDRGSKYKWHFLTRLLDPRPFYGVFTPVKPSFEEYVKSLRDLTERHPGRLTIVEVGRGAAGDPVYSARLGREGAPRFVLSGCVHGGEIQNAYGLRRLIEVLLENPGNDPRISSLLARYGVEVLPIVNAWGYLHGHQVNSRDCDLNRNFDYCWQEYKGDGGWRAKYKPEVLRGAAPFSEGEARGLRDRLLDGKLAGYVDFHQHEMQHGYMLCLPHKPVQRETQTFLFLHELLNARLAGRYLFGAEKGDAALLPGGPEGASHKRAASPFPAHALQLTVNKTGSAVPFAQNWAAAQGIPTCLFELPGGFEDSLMLSDILVQEALNVMWTLDAQRQEQKELN